MIMKKVILLTGVFICCISIVQAQINKGSILLGGGIGFNNNKVKDTDKKDHSVSIAPSVGIAVKQNIIVGLNFSYYHSKNEIGTYTPVSNSSSGLAVFARKYMPLGKRFYAFGETAIYYLNSKYIYTNPTNKSEQKSWTTGINIYPGLSYAVTKRFHLEAGLPQLANLGYSKTKNITNGTTTEENTQLGFHLSASSFSALNFGFRFFLSK